MTTYELDIDSAVFNDIYIPHLNNNTRTQIIFGGSSSGKSVFFAQRDVVDVLKGGRNFLVCRQVARTLRGSVVQEINKIISEWGLSDLFVVNKTDNTITCNNGYQIVFAGLDDVEKLKSITPAKGVFTDVRIDEATEAGLKTVKQLIKRQRGGSADKPKRLTLSFNPILQGHWIYEEYFSKIKWADDQTEYTSDNLTILKTWYIHNKYLTPEDINDLENETDEYFYEVYTKGNWGVLGNVIFKNWEVRDLADMRNQFVNNRNGLDFGFSADPAALTVSHYARNKKTIYIYEEFYEAGLTNDILAGEIISLIDNDLVVCDSAEPKSIAELKDHRVNAIGAKKGKDSVVFGIQWLQQQKIIINVSCINTKNEFMQYKWKEDGAGNPMRQPVDKNDHIISALRYAYEGDMGPKHKKPGTVKYV